ncbi:MAG: manganese efflux pump MntP family protein [Clostridia bacterium]|nr:manganese efflux pump MntP family protein [Clostridia bacterium]
MNLSLTFFITAIGFGAGLAMDAFSVSLANGLNEPKMKAKRMCLIAGMFSFFQAIMPLTGWLCIHTIAKHFTAFEKLIPWIALVLLLYIGGKMLIEGIRGGEEDREASLLTFSALILQGIATSIDALSTGFGIADYNFSMSLLTAAIIAAMTFVICMAGIIVGKKFGTHLAGKASILGGVILIAIGIYIFMSGVFG